VSARYIHTTEEGQKRYAELNKKTKGYLVALHTEPVPGWQSLTPASERARWRKDELIKDIMHAEFTRLTEDLHEQAVTVERGRRRRIVLTRAEVQVGDILDMQLVTAITNTDPVTRRPTARVRFCLGKQWTELFSGSETVSVHRAR
jgi:hypothetical protein